MTLPATSRRVEWTPGQLCFGFFAIFCLFLILRNPDTAIEYMSAGLRLCARTVIPSLFPFMVLSELIVSGGISKLLLRPVSAPLCRLFRLPPDGCCAALLGMLCGFPVGAKSAMSAYDRGSLTREEAERVLCFSNNPSSAFLINAVGVSLHGNRRFGSALLATVLSCAVLTGILLAHLPGTRTPGSTASDPSHRPSPRSGAAFFTDAIRSSVTGMLTVCAYVIFFSALCGTLTLLTDACHLPAFAKAAVFCLFELSGGSGAAASLIPQIASALLTAFAVGWSGISVHCQVLSVCDGRGLRFRRYFLAKLLQGGLCTGIFAIVLRIFPDLLRQAEQSTDAIAVSGLLPVGTVLFLLCLPLLAVGRKQT